MLSLVRLERSEMHALVDCMSPKCYAVQCIVSGEENHQNCPSPLGFHHPARGGPIHGHRQHPQKIGQRSNVLFQRYPDEETDREIHRHTNHNTCAPLTGVCKAMNVSFVIPYIR